MKSLIISADDFGLTASVNEAVEKAHRDGLLSTTSLMVSAPAAADAVARAKALPDLRVGLHLVLVEGQAVLAHRDIPAIADTSGQFGRNQTALGFRYFFDPRARDQLAKEIRAQFTAFATTGLALDHVNAHKHMHMHPTVARLTMEIGREFGCRAIRVPAPMDSHTIGAKLMAWWANGLRRKAAGMSYTTNLCVAGLPESGHFDESAFLAALDRLPDGVTEAYFHPAMIKDPAFRDTMPDYDHPAELAALLSPAARQSIADLGISLTTYTDLAAA